ncbi:MAG: proteasome subunit beta [Nanoarchaeota archaeon]|nr:proteasome subunit beta [Nanoarchaeota archaeon]MBU4241981.1 proteasome subunit beta [Nanoarchaeota archaeon]MBU4352041.1 proteasome subunit beta [Nanoarchaeota archaeon]MBU4456524.1 proteasome subunit beta [Nanoarchaeota archaeon]MCG2719300.1 proteasome subunit beta [Nanoarchaeota archaeon]
MKEDLKVHKGTTTVGIVCKEGIVLAADKRTSAGYLIANKKTIKIHKISDHMAITTAGLVSDAQLFTKIIKAQLKLLNIRKGKEPSVEEAANLLASLSYANIRRPSMVPGIVGFLLGGFDNKGQHLYELGIDGSISEPDDYCTDGSGSSFAMGVLETLYKKDMTLDEGIHVAVKAINAAVQRDLATGNGIDVITITKEGYKHVMGKMIDTNIRQ